MKATSRRTPYPQLDMIQRWKREKLVDDQNNSAGVFPFVFYEIYDDYFYQTDCVLSNLVDMLVGACKKNNISTNQHDPTVDARDMATRALLPSLDWLLQILHFSF
jgi:hypothetical protein